MTAPWRDIEPSWRKGCRDRTDLASLFALWLGRAASDLAAVARVQAPM